MSGRLYLLPTPIANGPAEDVLPAATLAVARRVDYFLAENAKSARAALKAMAHPQPIAALTIIEIGHHPDPAEIDRWLAPLLDGRDAAIVSEAGCPGVADPGAQIVDRAHALGLSVQPLVGPSSLLLALMASGLNGQAFRFVGYLPHEAAALGARLRELEQQSRSRAEAGETQLWIETPYRNERMLAAVLSTCQPTTRLTLAVDLTGAGEQVVTRHVAAWRSLPKEQLPPLHRVPAVFALLAAGAPPQVRGSRT